jgi:hypothetical protein
VNSLTGIVQFSQLQVNRSSVMPAKAGIQASIHLDSRFRGNDDEQKADFKSTN